MIALVLTIMLVFLAFGFAGVAVFIGLSAYFTTAVAALLTMAAYLTVALVILAVAAWLNRSPRQKTAPAAESETSLNEIEAVINSLSHPALTSLIREHPGKTIATTVVAGIIVGYSKQARTVLKTVCEQHSAQR
jgi:type VI protein secretion system component VasK